MSHLEDYEDLCMARIGLGFIIFTVIVLIIAFNHG